MKKKKAFNKIAVLAICMFLLVTILPVQSMASDNTDSGIAEGVTLDDLAGKTAGVMTGTPQDEIIKAAVKDPDLLYFNNFTDMALALQTEKIDYYINSTISFRIMQETYPDFDYVNDPLKRLEIGAIFQKSSDGETLCKEFDAYIDEIRDNGTLEQLQNYWLYPNDWEAVDIPDDGEKGVLHVAVSSSTKPFCFVKDGKYVGFDIAVVAGFCNEYGYGLQLEDTDLGSAVSAVAAGKCDLAASQISWTAERAKSVLYSDFYCEQELVAIVRDEDTAQSSLSDPSEQDSSASDSASESAETSKAGENKGIWESVVSSFQRTLLDENRWQMILGGLGITLIITLFGFILANLLGALFCSMAMSPKAAPRVIADVYSRIMQGTPIVVILMILYYIVFAKVQLSGVIVAIVGFGITSGAYMAQLFQGAIEGVDKGQTEAALAIGFTETEAFRNIVLPQAIRTMLPGYFSELISLMKGTAIVGYIAVMDLTKVGDVIRSSTFEPFFPLIVTAVIYFVIACILLSVLKLIQKKLAPKRARSENKGGVRV